MRFTGRNLCYTCVILDVILDIQHCWELLANNVASVCTPCCMLLDVVACCCAKFETGQTFQATTPNISFVPWSPKRSATMLDPFAQLFQHCWGHALQYKTKKIAPLLGLTPQNLKYQKLCLSSKLTRRPTLLIIGQFHYYQISIESSKKLCTTEWETLLKSTAYYIRLNKVFVKLTQPNMLFLIW